MEGSQVQIARRPFALNPNQNVRSIVGRNGAGVLNSWKEIAAYLGHSVRTLQRWEREAGLPVHRPYRRKRSSVVALKSEIDAWLAHEELGAMRDEVA